MVAVGPDSKQERYLNVLRKIAGSEMLLVDDYSHLHQALDNATTLICRK